MEVEKSFWDFFYYVIEPIFFSIVVTSSYTKYRYNDF